MSTVVEHRTFSKTDLAKNNNKFWIVWFYDDGGIETQNGRQGALGQKRFISATGRGAYESKVREKINKGYLENEVVDGVQSSSTKAVSKGNLSAIASKQIKSKDPTVNKLVDFLVKVNAHNIAGATGGKITYDASTASFKTAVGVISASQVAEARRLLSDLSDLVAKNKHHTKPFERDINAYLSLIPRDFGRQRMNPEDILPDLATCQQENDLLDSLDTSFAGVITQPKKKTGKKTKDSPKVFDVQLEPVTDKKIESWVKNLYQQTRKAMHQSNSLSVHAIWAVRIANMAEAFDKYGAKMKDIRTLWHGTKASNLLSILRQGLIIPPSSSRHCTGRMYGNGVYASSVSTKALGYATDFWGSGGNTDRIFMFLLDMAMGKYYEATSWGSSYPKSGTDSTWAKAGRALRNDEMIVYRLDQCNLTYLVEFRQRKGY